MAESLRPPPVPRCVVNCLEPLLLLAIQFSCPSLLLGGFCNSTFEKNIGENWNLSQIRAKYFKKKYDLKPHNFGEGFPLLKPPKSDTTKWGILTATTSTLPTPRDHLETFGKHFSGLGPGYRSFFKGVMGSPCKCGLKINGFHWGYFTPRSGVIRSPTYNWYFVRAGRISKDHD